MFDVGIRSVPPLAVTSTAIWLTLAYQARNAGLSSGNKIGEAGKVGRYVAAGLLCIAMVPYTPIFLGSTNTELMKMGAEAANSASEAVLKNLQGQTAHQLVDQWGMLNLPRAAFLFVGGVLGLWTAMD